MPLTDVQIRAIKPGPKLIRKADGGGLYIEVSPKGTRVWRLGYRFNGSKKTMLLGLYPEMKLAEARHAREIAKADLREGKDPRGTMEPVRPGKAEPEPPPSEPEVPEERTWRHIQENYLDKRAREGAAQATLNKRRVHASVLNSVIGGFDIAEVKARHVLQACRVYEDKGQLDSAQAVRTLASQVFRFAIAQGLAEYDPAAPTRDALAKPRRKHFAAVTDPKEVGALMRTIRAADGRNSQVRAALLLSAYLFPRSSTLREMRWADIDGDFWIAPAKHMKLPRDHIFPLPRQAKEVIEWMRPVTGSHERVLHSFRTRSGLMSENTLNRALDDLGFGSSRHRQHGFRTTFSTNMHEQGWRTEWIEMQLAHVDTNSVRAAYNKAQYLDERIRMMQAYAD